MIICLSLLGEEISAYVFLKNSARIVMSFVVVVPPSGSEDVRRVPWTSSSALHRFVWVVYLDVGVGSGPRVDCSRAAVWTRKLKIVVPVSENGAPAPSADEAMFFWIVVSVRCGWAPKGVLVWFLPSFGELLCQIIMEGVGEE